VNGKDGVITVAIAYMPPLTNVRSRDKYDELADKTIKT